ncbi:MAG: T9SS type A sorting domain-containing protein [Salinivirgaceae bacterium]|nr:T9SS type A sorting domain-containing protein [Salinivirgaceae bacterium]
MKTLFTFKKFLSKKAGWLTALLFLAVLFSSCYKFYLIDQPTEGLSNSSFDVNIVVKEDDGDNDFTGPDLQNIGLFGVLVPDGWTVTDNIAFSIIASDSQYDNNGTLGYSASVSTMLEDSIGSPDNYHWWGSETLENADMSFFDSLSFTVTINTDANVGTFYLRYAIGDKDYWDRNPADDLSDPMPIIITENPNSITLNEKASFSVFPNPTNDIVTINLNGITNNITELTVYDVSGKKLNVLNISKANNSIDLNEYPKGVYFLKIVANNEILTQKILLK